MGGNFESSLLSHLFGFELSLPVISRPFSLEMHSWRTGAESGRLHQTALIYLTAAWSRDSGPKEELSPFAQPGIPVCSQPWNGHELILLYPITRPERAHDA